MPSLVAGLDPKQATAFFVVGAGTVLLNSLGIVIVSSSHLWRSQLASASLLSDIWIKKKMLVFDFATLSSIYKVKGCNLWFLTNKL